ncbi:Uncharacterised protein [Mycobacteroides abscessus subsp. abscessus]|nr:Uncharacterised protein [Mycobacteroides abscessus subsp. abscessus]
MSWSGPVSVPGATHGHPPPDLINVAARRPAVCGLPERIASVSRSPTISSTVATFPARKWASSRSTSRASRIATSATA